jgi:hypothetical protein
LKWLLVESKNVSIVEKFGCHKRAEHLLLRRTAQRAAAVLTTVTVRQSQAFRLRFSMTTTRPAKP